MDTNHVSDQDNDSPDLYEMFNVQGMAHYKPFFVIMQVNYVHVEMDGSKVTASVATNPSKAIHMYTKEPIKALGSATVEVAYKRQ